jgi:hypothetical protein
MSTATVMLVRLEVFEDGILRSTHLRLSTAAAGKTFTDLHAALKAYRAAARRPAETARLKQAA